MAQRTRLGQIGIPARPYGGFTAKAPGAAPAVQITRLGQMGISARAYAGFTAKAESAPTGPPEFEGFLQNVGRMIR